jgi:hypothetical protein
MESAAIASFETVCHLLNNSIDEKNIQGDDYLKPTSINLIKFIDLLQSMVSNFKNMKIFTTTNNTMH